MLGKSLEFGDLGDGMKYPKGIERRILLLLGRLEEETMSGRVAWIPRGDYALIHNGEDVQLRLEKATGGKLDYRYMLRVWIFGAPVALLDVMDVRQGVVGKRLMDLWGKAMGAVVDGIGRERWPAVGS